MARYSIEDSTLISIADAIRTKTETSAPIAVGDMANKIADISTGINTSDATASANEILSGETAYVNGEKVTGTIANYDGSYECSGESTGGGSVEVWTGRVYGNGGLGDMPDVTAYYVDETLSLREIVVPMHEEAIITVAAHTLIGVNNGSIHNIYPMDGANIETILSNCDIILPTANGFTING